jgi:hypothetical protein
MSLRRVLSLAILPLSVACVQTSATMLSTAPRPAVEPSAVVIYTSADKVPGKYDEVALIDSHGDDALTSYHGMLESMRKKAGGVGANGIILASESEAGTGAKIAHALIGTSADRKGKAVAIYVYPASASVGSAQGVSSHQP